MKRTKSTYLALLAVLLSPMAVNATLIGQTITVNDAFSAFSPDAATIGAGVEFDFVNLEFFDFDSNSLTIFGPGGGHGWGDFGFITFSGFDNIISGLSIISNTGYSGDVLSDFSFSSNSLTLHWGISQRLGAGGELVFRVDTTSVPEPGTLALLGIGLAGMGLARRRRKV